MQTFTYFLHPYSKRSRSILVGSRQYGLSACQSRKHIRILSRQMWQNMAYMSRRKLETTEDEMMRAGKREQRKHFQADEFPKEAQTQQRQKLAENV